MLHCHSRYANMHFNCSSTSLHAIYALYETCTVFRLMLFFSIRDKLPEYAKVYESTCPLHMYIYIPNIMCLYT